MSKKNEHGAVLVIVASSLLLLMGFTALAVDAGLGYSERRGSTNAADNAALAAAWEECNPTGASPQPAAAARATAAANGYDHASPDIDVDAQSLGDGQWQVTITKVNDGVFSPATPFADDQLTIVSEAVALCDPTEFLEGMALFAGAKGCPAGDELILSGATVNVQGGIHSNGQLQTPPGAVLSGPITYGETSTPTPPGDQDPIEREYPIELDIAEYRPGGPRAVGDYFDHTAEIDNQWLVDQGYAVKVGASYNEIRMTQSGIYYTSNSIDIQSVSANPGTLVTFVAEGEIKLSGANNGLVGYDPVVPGGTVGVLLYSDYSGSPNCNPSLDAIRFTANASLADSSGILFAPNGNVQLSNASIDLDGSIIGFQIRSSGATLNITYQNDPNFVPDYQVELLR